MRHRLIATLLFLTILLAACNLPGGGTISEADAVRFAQETLQAQLNAENQQAQDQAAPPEEQAPADSSQDAAPATETPIPATPTITLTPTSSIPMVSVSTATNCRTGPGIPYEINGALSPGQNGIIAAQSSVNNYVLIQNPAGGPNCWLWLQYATITGDISGLPVVTPPPSPTPTFTPTPIIDWSGTWTVQASAGPFTLNLTQSGNSVTGSEPSGLVSITGTVSPNGLTLSGTFTTSLGSSGTFTWAASASNYNQFSGNFVQTVPAPDTGPWCGGRNGAGLPATCLGP